MKATFDLPDELVREVKLRAVVQGRTVKDLVTELLREGLGLPGHAASAQAPASGRVAIDDEGLPVIRCASHAPASRMSAEELLELEQIAQTEEDSKRAGFAG